MATAVYFRIISDLTDKNYCMVCYDLPEYKMLEIIQDMPIIQTIN